jgi:RimJ/RimL family protein N-acetyltransferase
VNILQRNDYSFREVEDNDHNWLVELHNDPLVLNNITNPNAITLDSHMRWWNSLNPNKEKRFIYCLHKERVGFVKFYNIDKLNNNCILGADIHFSHRGRGLAKPMWEMMLQYSFEVLELNRVGLTVAEYNDIAQKVYTGVGFVTEGTCYQSLYRNGKYYNQLYMYMTKDMYVSIL